MKLPSFDIVGSREKAVAIIEMPEDRETAKKIAEEIMRIHKNVKTVLGKVGERKGEFRIRDYEVIMGEEDTEVVHKEYGCFFKLDPRKVYFSPREATERQRIASLVKPGEKVLEMHGKVAEQSLYVWGELRDLGRDRCAKDGHLYRRFKLFGENDGKTALQRENILN